MLYGHESISQYNRSNIAVWMSMSFQAGLLNIGGFMACHRFVSHVTGFATFFALEVSEGNTHHQAIGMLVVPAFFLLGAMISGQLVDLRLSLHHKPKYYITFGLIFFIISAICGAGEVGWFGNFGEPLALERDYLLLILLCLVCGIQNGTVTTVSRSVVRTTHLTGITTDLGIGLVRFLNRKKWPGNSEENSRANLMRVGIIVSFGLGSLVGGFAFQRYGFGGFSIPALTSGILFFMMIYFQVLKKYEPRES